ncbi:hypothetical protein SCOCK_180133 [Actinacidiphila cocklensis]|uniref:Uncharacterized protein n=1 Tax=Actinacidiphila cocklensis TaxID=887465 RepID=A0A9W4GRL9_9ACTN|nr:hypothetical protein SCOCK_180133 [Actinacidiphila cocklensis]
MGGLEERKTAGQDSLERRLVGVAQCGSGRVPKLDDCQGQGRVRVDLTCTHATDTCRGKPEQQPTEQPVDESSRRAVDDGRCGAGGPTIMGLSVLSEVLGSGLSRPIPRAPPCLFYLELLAAGLLAAVGECFRHGKAPGLPLDPRGAKRAGPRASEGGGDLRGGHVASGDVQRFHAPMMPLRYRGLCVI